MRGPRKAVRDGGQEFLDIVTSYVLCLSTGEYKTCTSGEKMRDVVLTCVNSPFHGDTSSLQRPGEQVPPMPRSQVCRPGSKGDGRVGTPR